MHKSIGCCSLAFAVLACTSYTKPLAQLDPPPATNTRYSFSPNARPIKLTTLFIDIPLGTSYGELAFGWGTCDRRRPLLNRDGTFKVNIAHYADAFGAVLKSHGFPVDDQVELFEDTKERTADLQVGARITRIVLNECYPHVDRDHQEGVGSASMEIEWSVYSTVEKKIVFKAVTQGSTYSEVRTQIGEAGILRLALADAAERLANDPALRAVVDSAPGPSKTASEPALRLPSLRPLTGELKDNLAVLRKAVVTINANKGMGSGFAIAPGYVLTAEHVVSGSKFVKLTSMDGKECFAEVSTADPRRDLALLKGDCPGVSPLPIAAAEVQVGSEVYAVGTPLSQKLEFSVTKGVISARRKLEGLDFIQSDVSVLPGSSGGPLVDSHGNALGVSTGGFAISKIPLGLNFFIPLTDLESSLRVKPAPPASAAAR